MSNYLIGAIKMKRVYQILTSPSFTDGWNAIPSASIDVRPWEEGSLLPPAEAKVAFDGSYFHVLLKAWEQNLRVVTHQSNGPVWEDSCIEFFFNPALGRDSRYLNFEVNAEGVMLLGLGSGRDDRTLVNFDPMAFEIKADVPPHGAAGWNRPFYTVSFVIPVSFLETIYGNLQFHRGSELAGNFQKCGDKTANRHLGCWNPIEVPKPDFHRPEWFGTLVIS